MHRRIKVDGPRILKSKSERSRRMKVGGSLVDFRIVHFRRTSTFTLLDPRVCNMAIQFNSHGPDLTIFKDGQKWGT